jgi:hypothetical protein
MSSTAATAIQAGHTDQTVSSVLIHNSPHLPMTTTRAYSVTVTRFVRDVEDQVKTTIYLGQPCALYVANRPVPGWFSESRDAVMLSPEYSGQAGAASQQLVFIDSQTLRALRELAKEHFNIEPGLHLIAVYSKSFPSEYLLLEVNDEAIPTGSVEPFYFAPGKNFGWPIYIADVTCDEWTKIENNAMKLPQGWPREPMLIFRREEVLRQ